MKPYGVTADLRVVRPTRTEDAIWEAVEAAIDEGLTPEQFKAEAAQAWSEILHERARSAARVLTA
jgi:hypothetical protein